MQYLNLLIFIESIKMKKIDKNKKNSIKLVEFKNSDIVRHPIISLILDMYDENNNMEINITDVIIPNIKNEIDNPIISVCN